MHWFHKTVHLLVQHTARPCHRKSTGGEDQENKRSRDRKETKTKNEGGWKESELWRDDIGGKDNAKDILIFCG